MKSAPLALLAYLLGQAIAAPMADKTVVDDKGNKISSESKNSLAGLSDIGKSYGLGKNKRQFDFPPIVVGDVAAPITNMAGEAGKGKFDLGDTGGDSPHDGIPDIINKAFSRLSGDAEADDEATDKNEKRQLGGGGGLPGAGLLSGDPALGSAVQGAGDVVKGTGMAVKGTGDLFNGVTDAIGVLEGPGDMVKGVTDAVGGIAGGADIQLGASAASTDAAAGDAAGDAAGNPLTKIIDFGKPSDAAGPVDGVMDKLDGITGGKLGKVLKSLSLSSAS